MVVNFFFSFVLFVQLELFFQKVKTQGKIHPPTSRIVHNERDGHYN